MAPVPSRPRPPISPSWLPSDLLDSCDAHLPGTSMDSSIPAPVSMNQAQEHPESKLQPPAPSKLPPNDYPNLLTMLRPPRQPTAPPDSCRLSLSNHRLDSAEWGLSVSLASANFNVPDSSIGSAPQPLLPVQVPRPSSAQSHGHFQLSRTAPSSTTSRHPMQPCTPAPTSSAMALCSRVSPMAPNRPHGSRAAPASFARFPALGQLPPPSLAPVGLGRPPSFARPRTASRVEPCTF